MSQEKCPIFCYHGVKENPRPWDVTKERLLEQVEWLSENFNLLTVSEMYERQKEGNLPENPAVLTFDDGLKSTFKARKVLNKHDVNATFYIISGLLGENWEGEEVITEDDVKTLAEEGHEIGAHTVSHPHITELDEDNIEKEIRNCKDELEKITENRVASFVYPYGDFSDRVAEVVEKTDIETALTTRPKTKINFEKPYKIPRLTVFNWHKLSHIQRFAEGKNYLYRNYWYLPVDMLRNGAIPFPLKKEYKILKASLD
jgi:peptidoglycan/xylan/chitin deacetylase (PgdA/CDA1 family)